MGQARGQGRAENAHHCSHGLWLSWENQKLEKGRWLLGFSLPFLLLSCLSHLYRVSLRFLIARWPLGMQTSPIGAGVPEWVLQETRYRSHLSGKPEPSIWHSLDSAIFYGSKKNLPRTSPEEGEEIPYVSLGGGYRLCDHLEQADRVVLFQTLILPAGTKSLFLGICLALCGHGIFFVLTFSEKERHWVGDLKQQMFGS